MWAKQVLWLVQFFFCTHKITSELNQMLQATALAPPPTSPLPSPLYAWCQCISPPIYILLLEKTIANSTAAVEVEVAVITRCEKEIVCAWMWTIQVTAHNYLSINNKLNDAVNQQEFLYLRVALAHYVISSTEFCVRERVQALVSHFPQSPHIHVMYCYFFPIFSLCLLMLNWILCAFAKRTHTHNGENTKWIPFMTIDNLLRWHGINVWIVLQHFLCINTLDSYMRVRRANENKNECAVVSMHSERKPHKLQQ